MITVGEVRKALDWKMCLACGLGDNKPVRLQIVNNPPQFVNVEFISVESNKNELLLKAEVTLEGDDGK